jgi:hypothetical protein
VEPLASNVTGLSITGVDRASTAAAGPRTTISPCMVSGCTVQR